MPLAPLHSINGDVRKSSRQDPGEDKDWPPPSFPAAVCCEKQRGGNEPGVKLQSQETEIQIDNVSATTACYAA